MPSYWVSEPYVNVRIEDSPLFYTPARGLPITFHTSYRQRGAIQEDPTIFGLGPNWSCSFRAFLVDLSSGASLLRLHKGSAGYIDYTNGVPQYLDGSLLGSVSGGYQIVFRDGSTNTFTHAFTDSGGNSLYFLTSQSDPAGNTTTYTYSTDSTIAQLVSVSDPDGNATHLYYENTTFTNQITKVVDPFSRTNLLQYDTSGYLTNTVDVAGLTNSFAYDAGNPGWITNMTTPYGSTVFAYGGCDATSSDFYTTGNQLNRFVTVTLPNAGHELYLYRHDCSGILSSNYSPVPSTSPLANTLDNVDQNYRNSFHWSPIQYDQLSTSNPTNFTSRDYLLGRLRHWLADPSSQDPSDTVSLNRAPSPDGSTTGQLTWYDYDGKTSGNNYLGTNCYPAFVALVLPDGSSTRFTRYFFNPFNNPTETIGTYSKADGSIGLRTNNFYYAANNIDLLQWVGPNHEQITSNYFASGNVIHEPNASYDALDQQTLFSYNANGQVTEIQRPSGLTTVNTYASAGAALNRLTNTTDVEINRTNSYTYYANGLVSTHTDERGLLTTSFWDNLQRLTGTSYPDGTAISNVYTILDLTGTKDRLGNWIYASFNQIRRKTAETNANGVVTRYGYCDCGALFAVTNAWNTTVQQVTTFAYDYQGNRTYTYLPDITITNWFNALQQLYTSWDSRGYRYLYYNNQGLLTNTSNAYGTEQATIFDNEDRPLYVTDANGVTVTNSFDSLARLATRKQPDGGTEYFGYSPPGLIAYTNQLGLVTRFGYDAAGRKTSETNANLQVTQFSYNSAGDLLTLTDPKSQVTTWHYDAYGRVTNKLDQTSTEIFRYKYDPDDRLTNRWSAAKGNTAYTYDNVGNLTFISYPVSPSVSFQYDALNRLTKMVDGAGTNSYTYTAGNQLLSEGGVFANDTVTNGYVNRLRTALGLKQPSGEWTNGFGWDLARRISSVASPAGTFQYAHGPVNAGYAGGLVSGITLPNGAYITNFYDSVARLTGGYLKSSANAIIDSALYGYNQASQRLAYTNAGGAYVQYTYDPIGQLKVATSSVSGQNLGYAYDAAWNMSYYTNQFGPVAFTVDTKNELTNSDLNGPCTYDSNGNMITRDVDWGAAWYTYCYDDENRLVTWTSSASGPPNCGDPPSSTSDLQSQFVYDGLGRLRERLEYVPDGSGSTWVLSSETEYIYDGNRVIQERDGSNNPLVSYTRGPDLNGSLEGAGGIGGLLARSASGHSYYHADGNGNITCLIATNQSVVASYSYDPYGNLLSSSGTLANANVYRFSSKECHLNSGMYYYGYRFYDPSVQRWLTRDPVTDLGFISTAPHLRFYTSVSPDLYIFIANCPTCGVDPQGLTIWSCSVQTKCFPLCGLGRHAYLWDDRPGTPANMRECGQEGSCGSGGNSSGNQGPIQGVHGTPPGYVCNPVGGDGNEDAIMADCRANANNGIWIPGINDCHNSLNRCLTRNDLPIPFNPRFGNPVLPPRPPVLCSTCTVNVPTSR